jgi:hypothetical protein
VLRDSPLTAGGDAHLRRERTLPLVRAVADHIGKRMVDAVVRGLESFDSFFFSHLA